MLSTNPRHVAYVCTRSHFLQPQDIWAVTGDDSWRFYVEQGHVHAKDLASYLASPVKFYEQTAMNFACVQISRVSKKEWELLRKQNPKLPLYIGSLVPPKSLFWRWNLHDQLLVNKDGKPVKLWLNSRVLLKLLSIGAYAAEDTLDEARAQLKKIMG